MPNSFLSTIMRKSLLFPWRPIIPTEYDVRKSSAYSDLLTPIYRENIYDFRRPNSKLNYDVLRTQVNTRTMENRIVSNVLEKNINFINRHLVLSPTVLEKLRENGVITESVKKQLEFKDTDEQVPFLIQSFSNRGLLTFKRFLAVLRETGHGWMVDHLLNSEALSFEELNSSQGRLGQSYPRTGSGLPGDMSRLDGLTSEHARLGLSSATLRGRGDGYGMDIAAGRYNNNEGLDRAFGSDSLQRRGIAGNGSPNYGGRGMDSYGGTDFRLSGLGRVTSGKPTLQGLTSDDNWRRASFTPHKDVSLGSLMAARRQADDSARYRGRVSPAALIGDSLRYPARDLPASTQGDVPGALLDLHDHFKSQTDVNEQTLTVLKREEIAIKELLEQNSKEQMKIRRNQGALSDIGRRLEEINTRAHDVYDPVVHGHLTRYRLTQLNQIPWSSER